MSAVIEALTQLYEVYDLLKDADSALTGAERAIQGKNPFPASDKIEAQFKALGVHEQRLKALAAKGIGKPVEKKVTTDELANPKTRSQAAAKLKANLAVRDAFAADARKLLDALKKTEKDAQARSTAARGISQGFADLIKAPLPDVGTVGKTEYFELHQLFQRAAGSLGSVATAAKQATAKVSKDLSSVEEETENLRANLKTFGVR